MYEKDIQISDAKKKQPAKFRMWKILPELFAFPTNKWYRGKKVSGNCQREKDNIINIKQVQRMNLV